MSGRTIVAIDGPAGAGKSTVAKLIASRLGVAHIDTGATYRLVALRALEENVPLDDVAALSKLATLMMERCHLGSDGTLTQDGRSVGMEIRTPEVSRAASIVAAHPEVRSVLVFHQRRLVPSSGAVVEGRDIGTVVWPDADVKVYLDAHPDVRAQRRTADEGVPKAEVTERDQRDATRPVGPMQAAPDAIVIDTSELSPAQVADRIIGMTRGGRPDLFYAGLRSVLVVLLRGVFRLEIVGAERIPSRGAVILAPNHRSLIDIPVAAAATKRKVWFMAKEELFRSKVGGGLIRRLGGFQVKRGRPDRRALQRALELLKSGEIVGIFPEGTRTPSARFEELEEGFAYVALKSGAPIVPVAISGTEAVFPPGSKLPRLVKIRVAVGEPFHLSGRQGAGILPRARIREATVEAQQRLAGVMNGLEPV